MPRRKTRVRISATNCCGANAIAAFESAVRSTGVHMAVMMQAFYWDAPAKENKHGEWWNFVA